MRKRALRKDIRDRFVSLFWLLPHDVRRTLFSWLQPAGFEAYQQLRTLDSGDENSLRPFDEHEAIFVHIPKCAGISVGNSLFGHTPGSHMSVLTFQLIYSKEEYDRYFKFTFIRNPWDRLVSAFHFLKRGGLTLEDRQWAKENLAPFPDFDTFVREWVTPQSVLTWQHFKPQTRFICNARDEVQVDFVGRLERIEEDYAAIARRLGVQDNLQYLNRSSKKPRDYRAFYTAETKAIVAAAYRRDIELLGYDFDGIAEAGPAGRRPAQPDRETARSG